MKTSVIMVRPMGSFEVYQRTSDGFFDGNALLRQWNSVKGNPERKMSRFFEADGTKNFLEVLEEDISQGAKMHDGVYQSVKEIKGRITRKGKTKDQVWMHPYLFIKFAMWINPRFEVQVIKFVYDQLIKFRHDAGDNYNRLASAISRFPDVDYREVANAINWIVFNKIGKELRQSATQKELEEVSKIEDNIITMINLGMVTNHAALIGILRKMYWQKYNKF